MSLTQGVSALNDDQLTQVKDQVWQSYVNNQLIAAEAAKLGLTVSKACLLYTSCSRHIRFQQSNGSAK